MATKYGQLVTDKKPKSTILQCYGHTMPAQYSPVDDSCFVDYKTTAATPEGPCNEACGLLDN